jgi:hypothetical protein
MTKPSIRNVSKSYDAYYDESAEEIEHLFAKLDIAKASTTKAATKLADAKETALKISSGLFDHLDAAEYRAEAEKALAKETPEKPKENLIFQRLCHVWLN